MSFLDDQFLDDILNEYHDGYAKTYKYIPDLVKELRAARKVVEAARKLHDMEHVRHVEENIPTSKWVANLYSALKELDGDK